MPPSPCILVAHVLPADVRQHALALLEAKLLDGLYTGYVYCPSKSLERLGSAFGRTFGMPLNETLEKRPPLAAIPENQVHRSVAADAIRMWCERYAKKIGGKVRDWSKQVISHKASKAIRNGHRLVIARDMEAMEVFKQAKAMGVSTAYQYPTADFRLVEKLLTEEHGEYGDLDSSLSHSQFFAEPRVRRKAAEFSLADVILTPSEFVKKSLVDSGHEAAKIRVLPFGCEEDWCRSVPGAARSNEVLHVCQLSVRKGTHRLLQVWKRLGAYRTHKLKLIGSMRLPANFLEKFSGCYEYLGRIPRNQLPNHFSSAQFFVLPALAEGFAVVILESLSAGTPIVASRNSGAEGFISDGVEGLLHDTRNDDQLADSIDRMLTNPSRCEEMGRAAYEKAKSWTWRDYRQNFRDILQPYIESAPAAAAT